MSITTTTAKIDRRYLRNKTKEDIIDILMWAFDEQDRLRAERTWQPIETALKDGSSVLLWCGGHTAWFPISGYWHDDQFNKERSCWTDGATDRYEEFYELNPTHWMPLPEGPKC